jgi:hypothetical protein
MHQALRDNGLLLLNVSCRSRETDQQLLTRLRQIFDQRHVLELRASNQDLNRILCVVKKPLSQMSMREPTVSIHVRHRPRWIDMELSTWQNHLRHLTATSSSSTTATTTTTTIALNHPLGTRSSPSFLPGFETDEVVHLMQLMDMAE